MAFRPCPACRRPVPADASRCGACGAVLQRPAGSHPIPLGDDGTLIWADGNAVELPVLDEPLPEPPARQPKAERRAAVRRARLRHASAPEGHDVLVLDPDPDTRAELCRLLLGFGFGLLLAEDPPDAIAIAGRQCLSAAFVDVPFDDGDGGDGVALCHAVKAARRSPGGRPTALVLATPHDRALLRIRAELAGCDAVIVKPPRRGDVARALERLDVAMPADPRAP